jgi:hypothetical protein
VIPANKLKGTDGRITYPAIGALIAETFAWHVYSEDGKVYTLRARCKYLVDALWAEYGQRARIELRFNRDIWLIATPMEGVTVERNEREIIVKGVTLEKKES